MATTSASEPLQITREPDLVHLRVRGPFDLPVARAVHELIAQIMDENGRCYLLADMSQLDGIPNDARRYVGEWHKTHTITGVAVYGASFATRALATLMFHAVRIVGRQQMEMEFVRDEADARRWIAAHIARTHAATGGHDVRR
ncbi:STAS/SEC14 domain-containing protein [Nannocystis punicea]|uniref:STAS/SEC14 domain-containing protein n=1 Tax=Nannocystis punicea TaxID=2995304 RepID=A0ABY7HJ41_9BACT|nr:STAS/SEC14 domain-containing protein [Nannocystis poenicansa]WAS99308.1 STAS/SEC14 domain-containing protein [Nannocystis poenicansa]